MSKKEMIDELALRAGMPRSAAANFLQAFQSMLYEDLCTHGVFSWHGIGKFVVRNRKGYTGRNPRTGEPVAVPDRRIVHFKPSKTLTEYARRESSIRNSPRSVGIQ